MANAKSIYRRLTGRKRSLGGYSQLWLAPGHILLLTSTRFTEHYQRFNLADIQAIVVTALPDRKPAQILMAVSAVLWMLGYFIAGSAFAQDIFVITGALVLAMVLADIALGPRCRCHLYTAVSRELLPVSRTRAADRFLQQIRPVIEQVQGTLPEGSIEFAAPEKNAPEVPKPASYLPEALFALLLIDAVLLLMDARFPRAGISGIYPVAFLGEFLLVSIALFRRNLRGFVFVVVLAALVGIAWDTIGLAQGGMTWMTLVAEAGRQRPLPEFNTAWPGVGYHHVLTAACWRIAAGSAGLLAAWMERASA